MAEENPQAQAAGQQGEQQFALQRIYVKDLSFETPQGPDAFRQQWKPKVQLELNTRNNRLDDTNFEVVLTVGVTTKQDDKTAFLVEVQQAGIFHIAGFEPAQLTQILGTTCPTVLFPYARETIDTMVTKGSFPAVMLAPVNFEVLFHEAMRQEAAKREEAAAAGEGPASN